MTQYPVNYHYDKRDSSMYDGMAATAGEAQKITSAILTEANGEPTEAPLPRIMSTEAGPKGTREQVESWWADEIAAGWVSVIQVYGGWVAQVEYWDYE